MIEILNDVTRLNGFPSQNTAEVLLHRLEILEPYGRIVTDVCRLSQYGIYETATAVRAPILHVIDRRRPLCATAITLLIS